MLSLRSRLPLPLTQKILKPHSLSIPLRRLYSVTSENIPAHFPSAPPVQNVSDSNALPTSAEGSRDAPLQEHVEEGERQRQLQAPNRKDVWSQSQQPREKAIVGPRFEQTITELQPQPLAAIELIHKQPVRWSMSRVVSCDGGGGPLGHPRIFINLDKPQIHGCTYCGLPFAHEHHRHHLQSLASTPYPLQPLGDIAEVAEPQRVTDEEFAQR